LITGQPDHIQSYLRVLQMSVKLVPQTQQDHTVEPGRCVHRRKRFSHLPVVDGCGARLVGSGHSGHSGGRVLCVSVRRSHR